MFIAYPQTERLSDYIGEQTATYDTFERAVSAAKMMMLSTDIPYVVVGLTFLWDTSQEKSAGAKA